MVAFLPRRSRPSSMNMRWAGRRGRKAMFGFPPLPPVVSPEGFWFPSEKLCQATEAANDHPL